MSKRKQAKQALFGGDRVPLVHDGVPILYPRYSTVEEVLKASKEGKIKPRQVPAAAEADEQPRKKRKAADGSAAPSGAAGDDDAAEAVQPDQAEAGKKKKGEEGTAKVHVAARMEAGGVEQKKVEREEEEEEDESSSSSDDEEPASAAGAAGKGGNAEEAARLRSVLGFTSAGGAAPAAAAAAAPAANAEPPPRKAAAAGVGSSGFGFKFSVEERVAQETEEKLNRIHAVDCSKDGYVPRRVFVCGMPHEYSEEDIKSYWSYCGEIHALEMLRFPDSGNFNGVCFVTYASEQGYQAALACAGEQLEGRTLRVEKCKPAVKRPDSRGSLRQGSPSPLPAGERPAAAAATASRSGGGGGNASNGGGPAKTPGYHVAYVGNVAWEAGDADVKELFEPYGCKLVRLHTDKHTGKSKGFAHVHFPDEASLDGAMALDGAYLKGRRIKVSYGQPKQAAAAAAE